MPDAESVLTEIRSYFGTDQPPALFERMGKNEDYLQASWNRYRSVMAAGRIDPKTKELMGLAVAVAKSGDYMIALQRQRIGQADEELEALAVVDFFEGFDAFAHALHVDSELRPRRLLAGDFALIDQEIDVNVPYVIEPDDPAVAEVYAQIKSTMGIPFIPNIFKALAHQPGILKSKWEAYQAIMTRGRLSRLTKELIAVAVSAVNACFY